jgi:hypothetical protein
MKSAGAVEVLLMTRRGFKIDCFAAQKSAGLLAMTEEGCCSKMKSAGAVEVLLTYLNALGSADSQDGDIKNPLDYEA